MKKRAERSVQDRIIESLTEFSEALKKNEKLTLHRLRLNAIPQAYGPAMVKRARDLLGVSQAVFAYFLGVSVKTVRAWEQGINSPNRMACRFMDEIKRDPTMSRQRLRELTVCK